MSSTTIVILIFVGIIALLLLGYINHLLEKTKLDRARRRVELADRSRRCANLSTGLPAQLMSTDLKQLLNRLELHYIDQLETLDRNERKHKLRAEELRQWIAQGAEVTLDNPAVKINSDEQAKDVRFQLEGLQAQVIRAVEEKILSVAQGKQWLAQIKHMLVTLYIEYFNTIGQQFFEQNRPAQARLAFERALQYLKKQQEPALYKQPLQQFEAQLERANALEREQAQHITSQASELTSGLDSHTQEDWKKKQVYD